MSHFTVLVVGKDPEKQLSVFDENLEVPRYVLYTKKQLIAEERKRMEEYKNGIYAEYLRDPQAYKLKYGENKSHINYLEKTFPEKLKMSDEEIYKESIDNNGYDDIGDDGEVYSTYNPNSKWDWCVLGGRWDNTLLLKDDIKVEDYIPINDSYCLVKEIKKGFTKNVRVNSAYKKDVANLDELFCFAFLRAGKWYEEGRMGYWGIVRDSKPDWNDKFKELLNEVPDDQLISVYDCHI